MNMISASRTDAMVPATAVANDGEFRFNKYALLTRAVSRRKLHALAVGFDTNVAAREKWFGAFVVLFVDGGCGGAMQPRSVSVESDMPGS